LLASQLVVGKTIYKKKKLKSAKAVLEKMSISDISVGPVTTVGKRVGPMIERSLVRNRDWTATVF
jgi:hypothetical protein